MADDKNINDEYQYVEESDSDSSDTSESFEPAVDENEAKNFLGKMNDFMQKPNNKRNVAIVFLGFFLLLLIIKCSAPKTNKNVQAVNQLSYQQQTQAKQTPAVPQGGVSQEILSNAEEITQVLAAQKNLQNTISGLNEQINQLSTQVSSLNLNVQGYQQEISALQVKLNATEQMVEELKLAIKTRKEVVRVYTRPRKIVLPEVVLESNKYYIQAIIPGRAWLISSNGTTLTVTVGSKVPGYGTVRKIDALEGRVVMSSNRILRFNQEL